MSGEDDAALNLSAMLNATGDGEDQGLILGLLWGAAGAVIGLAKYAAILSGVGGLLAFFLQEKLLYFPQMPPGARTEFEDPERHGIRSENITKSLRIPTADGESLQAWLVHAREGRLSKQRDTVLLFHGNAGNLSHRLPLLRILHAQMDVNVLIVEYRGYGASTGTPSERGLQTDAQAALDFLMQVQDGSAANSFVSEHLKNAANVEPAAAGLDTVAEHINPARGVVLFGRSLGGAVAMHLASKSENFEAVRAVVVENTFTSIRDMMAVVMPWIPHIFHPLCRLGWPTLHSSVPHVARQRVPILFLSSKKDELVPPAMMKQLHETTVKESPKTKHLIKFQEIEEGDHMGAFTHNSYLTSLKLFLRELSEHHEEHGRFKHAWGAGQRLGGT